MENECKLQSCKGQWFYFCIVLFFCYELSQFQTHTISFFRKIISVFVFFSLVNDLNLRSMFESFICHFVIKVVLYPLGSLKLK